ncbi:MAG: hypothetical protein E2O69_10105 [Deltaproteobacteria bacterium]|nr:MAG: hypothetical protein E2O69_10105 [Deltaproteobacteria bacterium]
MKTSILRSGSVVLVAWATSLFGWGNAHASVITGVCPDGSMFIVRNLADIPCAAAKRVAPDDMPPIKPEYLPRPYGWQRFQREQDPNNPYNLLEDLETRDAQRPPPRAPTSSRAALTEPPLPSVSEPVPPRVRDGGIQLSDQEIADLIQIVQLTQQRAPANLEIESNGSPSLRLQLAHSRGFEAQAKRGWASHGPPTSGPVLLFTAEALAPVVFHPNFTFAQGHTAFHANSEDPKQFGMLVGRPGALEAGTTLLGYVVLPPSIDLAQPIDVYWNDHRLAATLRP